MKTKKKFEKLEKKAKWIRSMVLEAITASRKGHIGGTYSCVEILVALYYGGILKLDAKNPKWEDRDRFLIGKGHACVALYSIFMDFGWLSRDRFESYGKDGGLGGQLDLSVPGSEYNTGSLGHVLGIAAGMALAAKMDRKNFFSYALMGDAEIYEGSIWEALAFAGEHRLNRLVGIIDRNRLSVTDTLDDSGLFLNFPKKIKSFGWECHEVDGHSFPEILKVLKTARLAKKPTMIVAHTVKGKGVSFMENGVKWHHSVPTPEELVQARKELGA